MPIRIRCFVPMLVILSFLNVTNFKESKTIANEKIVLAEDFTPCQLNEKAMEQLHEIRVEKRHTQVMKMSEDDCKKD